MLAPAAQAIRYPRRRLKNHVTRTKTHSSTPPLMMVVTSGVIHASLDCVPPAKRGINMGVRC